MDHSRLPQVHRGAADEDSLRLIRKAAVALNGDRDPLSDRAEHHLRLRRLPRFYAHEVIGPVKVHLDAVVQNRTMAFIQGAGPKVGLSQLISDYANAFNVRAADMRRPERIAVVRVSQGCGSLNKFLDDLSCALRAPLSTTELRFRSSGRIAARILASARLAGISVLVFDHVRNAPPKVRALIGDLALLANPEMHIKLEPDEFGLNDWRVGIVVADWSPPQDLFAGAADLLATFDGSSAVLTPYTGIKAVADAIRQIDIGLDDLDMAVDDDRLLAEEVLSDTDGLPVRMGPLFQYWDLATRITAATRPNHATLKIAMRNYHKLHEVAFVDDSRSPHRLVYDLVAAGLVQGELDVVGDSDAASVRKESTASRSQTLLERRQARGMADAERRQLMRKGGEGKRRSR